jgi:hypothetical protein
MPGARAVSAFIGTAFVQDDAEAASKQWRAVADQLRPKVPKLAALRTLPGRAAQGSQDQCSGPLLRVRVTRDTAVENRPGLLGGWNDGGCDYVQTVR